MTESQVAALESRMKFILDSMNPFKVLDLTFKHPPTGHGREQFLKDWAKAKG
jgi:hypothetical protein